MTFLYRIFGMLLFYLYELTHNYGVAIILFTIIAKTLLLPLNIKSTKSMRETQKLQPMMQYLQKKYKNNPEKMQRETGLLYQIYHVNPMGGCLPMLLQLPIIYALFGALRQPEKYVFVGMNMSTINQRFLWIPNLADYDPYYILPILCVIFTFLLQKFTMSVNPAGDNPQAESTNNMMLYMMPLLIGFMAMRFPAGIALYWVVQNIYTLIQQFIMLRKPVEVIPIKEAEAKLAEYSKKKKQEVKVKRRENAQRMNDYVTRQNSNESKQTIKVQTKTASGKKVRKRPKTKIPQRKEQ